MSALTRIKTAARALVAPDERRSQDGFLGQYLDTRAGRVLPGVSLDAAAGVPVVHASIQARAEPLAAVPLRVLERTQDGGLRRDDHPVARVLNADFSREMTAFEGRELLSAWGDLHGNSFALVDTNASGQVSGLHPLPPGEVQIDTPRGRRRPVRLIWRPENGQARVLLPGEVLWIRHRSRDGVRGLSPIGWAREAIALGVDLHARARSWAQNSFSPSGVIKTGKMNSPEEAREYSRMWREQFGGPHNAGHVPVLPNADDFIKLGMSARDAEFVENRRLSNLDIARIFGVPPSVIGIDDHATFNNASEQMRAFVNRTLVPWARRIEAALEAALLTPSERATLYIRHDFSQLLRGDQEARFRAYQIGRQWGWLSVNDIRRLEDLPPVEGGDEYLSPLNMVPLGQQGGRQNAPDGA